MNDTIDLPVVIFPNEVMRYLGYRADRHMLVAKIKNKLVSGIDHARPFLHPKAVIKTYPVLWEESAMRLGETDFVITAPDVLEKFAGSSLLSVLAITIGPELEKEIAYLFATDDYTLATIVDACGSDAVEQSTNLLHEMLIAQGIQKGYQLTQRFSPGYGQWSVEQQPSILQLLDAEQQIGLSVTESFMLNPQKSVTAIVGWKPFQE